MNNNWNTHQTNRFLQILTENPQIILLLILFVIVYLYSEFVLMPQSKAGNKKRKNPLFKELEIQSRDEACGIIFGRIPKGKKGGNKVIASPPEKEGHILVVGGSGGGKTSGLLVPTLNSWNKNNPKNTAFVIDISGDISRDTTMENRIVYEPLRSDSEEQDNTDDAAERTPYDIFGYIDRQRTPEKKIQALKELAQLIMPDRADSSEAGDYYNKEGRKMLQAALIAFYFKGLDFTEICDKIVENSHQNLLNLIDATQNEAAIKLINGFEGVDERFTASAKQACEAKIALFATDEEIKQTVRRPKEGEIAFEPCQIENHNCFIRIPDEDLEYIAPLTEILTAQSLDYFKSRSNDADHQILFCLDEAASLGVINILPPLRKYRKRKVRLFVLTQAIADIDLTWGEKQRRAMLNNFKFKIILDSQEPDEQEYWARLIGYETKITLSTTKETTTQTEKREYIMEPTALANMGNNLIFLYPGGFRKLYKNKWFEK